VKKLIGIIAIVLTVMVVACGTSQPPNPLIGKWKLFAPPGTTSNIYCAQALVFTDTTQTITYAGKATSQKVTYNAMQTAVYPTTVYVMDAAGDIATHMTYNFPSKNQMVQDTAALCQYQRN